MIELTDHSTDEELRAWYEQEFKRVRSKARDWDKGVRATMEWSMPMLRGMALGTIEPVRSKPAPPRASRLLDVLGIELPKTRETLRIAKT